MNNYQQIADAIELKVEQTREIIKDQWIWPTVEQAILWMLSEFGEWAETAVVEEAEWARNNEPKKYDPEEKEIAQSIIMMATANIQIKKGVRSPIGSKSQNTSWVICHVLFGRNYDSISNDLLYRAVRFITAKNVNVDLLKVVNDECDRLVKKYTIPSTNNAKSSTSRSRNTSQLRASDSAT